VREWRAEADQERRRSHQLGVAAAEDTAPEQQKCDCEYRRARRHCISRRDWVCGDYHSRQAESRDGGGERVRDTPRAHIAIGDNEENPNTDSGDDRLHRLTRSHWNFERADRKQEYHLATRDLWGLGTGNIDPADFNSDLV
jgi:hypothetical protein